MSSSRRPDPPAPPLHPVPVRLGRRPWTLRAKLVAGIVALIVVVCALIGVITELALSRYLVQQVDERLPDAQERLEGPRGPGFGSASDQVQCTSSSAAVERAPDGSLFATVTDGVVGEVSVFPRFNDCRVISGSKLPALADLTPNGRPVTVSVPGSVDYRVVARQLPSGEVLVTGLSLAEVRATQVRLAVTMAAVAGVALLLGAIAVWLVVRQSLRPLDRVATTARQVSTLPLDRGEVNLVVRVPEGDTDPRTEVGQVGTALNQMLDNVTGALQARQASETRVRQFVADASHELRTPLAAIRGYAELARRGDHDPDAVSHALRRVESESARMGSLVDDLLLLARLDSGRPLANEEVDLTRVVLDAVSDAQVAGREHRWQLELPEEPVTVRGDAERLHQVLTNLLANARTHTPLGTTVVTGLRSDGRSAVLTVTDNGPGIAPALLPEIFNRFVRGDVSRSRAVGSTGLGLAIVAAVVAAHGGSVRVESQPGRTAFTVYVPQYR